MKTNAIKKVNSILGKGINDWMIAQDNTESTIMTVLSLAKGRGATELTASITLSDGRVMMFFDQIN